jgi:hypothetical protein
MWDCPITDLYQVLVQVPALAPFVRAFRAQQDLTLTEEKLTNTLDGHGVLQAELSTAQKEAVAQAAAEMNQEHQTRQECIIGRLKRQFELDQEILTEEAEWRQHREAALAEKIKDIGRREHVSVLDPTNTLMDFATFAIM